MQHRKNGFDEKLEDEIDPEQYSPRNLAGNLEISDNEDLPDQEIA